MRAIGNKLGVAFDETHLKTYDLGGIKLERAESWIAVEGTDRVHTKTESNVNHLETNPQIATVVLENPNLSFKQGDTLWLHYLAYETFTENFDVNGQDTYLIDSDHVIFTFTENGYKMANRTYLGKVEIEEAPRTASGIFLTSQQDVKNQLKIRITHVPTPYVNNKGVDIRNVAEIGDLIVPRDVFNYPITVEGEEFVVIRDSDIMAYYGD